MRTLIAMFKHETNSFSPLVTDIERFEHWCLLENEKVFDLTETNTAIGGYLGYAQESGWECITPVAAESMPSGPMSAECFLSFSQKILEYAPNVDLILLDLHGAMVTETCTDAEGLLLETIRAVAPNTPVAVALDFHANISEVMVANADIITGFHTYPHIDMKNTGLRAVRLLDRMQKKSVNPCMAYGRVPILPHTLKQGTDDEPFASLMRLCRTLEQQDDVLDISLFGGFPLSDTPFTGPSVIVITDNNPELAELLKQQLFNEIWSVREQMVYAGSNLQQAVIEAKNDQRQQVLLDHADNCGSGGTQDAMTVIKALHDNQLEDVAVATVCDPHAVQLMQVAGIDESITLSLGGKNNFPMQNMEGEPLTLTGKVKSLFSGRWKIHGEMYNGVEVDLGYSAVFDTGRMEIIVTSRHVEPWDKGIFIAAGINPEQKQYLVLKARIHHRASFNTITRNHKLLDGTGCTSSDYSQFPFRHLSRPIYPMDEF